MTARLLDPDSSSEGICTVKFCNLLAERGHEVTCLNGDDAVPSHEVSWMPRCRVVPLPAVRGQGVARRSRRRWVQLTRQKAEAGVTHLTGFNRGERAGRRRWRSGLEGAIDDLAPQLVVVRGAGNDFLPHLAMTDVADAPPWIAHYHDPWPLSLYPDPYRDRRVLISLLQERANRRVLTRADAVTFPSRRLLEWEARAARVDLQTRGVVVAHLGPDGATLGDLAPAADPIGPADRPLAMLHAGFLNRQRDPQPLLEGIERRLDRIARSDPSELSVGRAIRLELLGPTDAKLSASPGWQASVARLERAGWLVRDPRRVPYAESLAALRAADVVVLIAVGEPESPFFPAKLADLLVLDRPMLVLAPLASTPADVMGPDHPGFVPIGRPDVLDEVLDRLTAAAEQGTLDRFRPPPEARALVSPDRVGSAIDEALERAVEVHGRRKGHR